MMYYGISCIIIMIRTRKMVADFSGAIRGKQESRTRLAQQEEGVLVESFEDTRGDRGGTRRIG